MTDSVGVVTTKSIAEIVLPAGSNGPKSTEDKEVGTPNLGTNWLLDLLTFSFEITRKVTIAKRVIRVGISISIDGLVVAEQEQEFTQEGTAEEVTNPIPWKGFVQFLANPVVFGGQSLTVKATILECTPSPGPIGSFLKLQNGIVILTYTLNDNHQKGKRFISVGGR
jgi:hypothetical protein